MERKNIFSVGEYYHIYNRGNNKQKVYSNDFDKRRFMELLYLSNGIDPVVVKNARRKGTLYEIERKETFVNVGAYCLMPNHFHILLREKKEGGITKFMSKLLTGYSMYFNKRYERTGALFEGRFKSEYVDSDEYLKYLFAYIHLNPVKLIEPDWKEMGIENKADVKKHLAQYTHSSYLDYVGHEREESVILNKEEFPEYFQGPQDFENFVEEWLSFREFYDLSE